LHDINIVNFCSYDEPERLWSLGRGRPAGYDLVPAVGSADSRGEKTMKKRVSKRPSSETAPPGRTPVNRSPSSDARWTFLTNHSHVLILLAQHPALVLREVAVQVGITERAVQRIILDLEKAGFLVREKVGRQNHYRIRTNLALRHPIEAHRTIGDLVGLI
jgi:predicted transcriptional regulator